MAEMTVVKKKKKEKGIKIEKRTIKLIKCCKNANQEREKTNHL